MQPVFLVFFIFSVCLGSIIPGWCTENKGVADISLVTPGSIVVFSLSHNTEFNAETQREERKQAGVAGDA